MITEFDGKTYDLRNLGFKIHLPVIADSRDLLTRRIADFLDKKFALDTCTSIQYETPFYKIGCGGELTGGKGITLYGRTGTMQEMQELAQEIEQKFGKELADNVKRYDITFEDPLKLTNSVQARFAAYDHNPVGKLGTLYSFFKDNYNCVPKCGALRLKEFTTLFGEQKSCNTIAIKSLSDIDKKFLNGSSVMYSIDTFGELFTGRVENGKVPQAILDSLPDEYRAIHNLTDINIITRINKGTRNIVAVMLKDIVNNPNSIILKGDPPWLATLDVNVIDEAKQLLAQHEPETFKKLELMLPQLEERCPALSVLKKTTTLSNINAPAKKLVNPVQNVAKSLSKPNVIPGINAPTTGVQLAQEDMDRIFSTFARGENKPKIIKPTTPILEEVIQGALQKLHPTTIPKPHVAPAPNINEIVRIIFKHLKV